MTEAANLTFEERIAQKKKSGYDTIKSKEDVLVRKEAAEKLKNKPKQHKNTKKMPKERYSKLPVSVLRPLNLQSDKPAQVRRDPRFDNLSGSLNEGLFRESYAFVKEIQTERVGTLKDMILVAKKDKDSDKLRQLRGMLGEERDRMHKSEQRKKDKQILKDIKETNKDRVQHGQDPVFYKKRKIYYLIVDIGELKEFRHKDRFERLEKEGKLDEFIKTRQEENDKKRVRR